MQNRQTGIGEKEEMPPALAIGVLVIAPIAAVFGVYFFLKGIEEAVKMIERKW